MTEDTTAIQRTTKGRVALWDNLKFLLILLVVVGHFVDVATADLPSFRSIYLFIYAFHMPLFIFISGLFHRNKNIGQKILFYVVVGFLMKITFALRYQTDGSFVAKFPLFGEGGPSWFMFVIAAYTLLLYLLRNYDKRLLLGMSILIACLAGYDHTIGDFLYISRFLVFLPFYILGTIFDPDAVVQRKRSFGKPAVLLGLAIIIVWACVCLFNLDTAYTLRHLFTGRNPYSDVVLAFGPAARLLCYGVSFAMGAALVLVMTSRELPGVTKWGSRSLDVYFWHWVVFVALELSLGITGLLALGFWGKLVYLLIPIPVTIVLSLGGPISWPLKKIKQLCKPVQSSSG